MGLPVDRMRLYARQPALLRTSALTCKKSLKLFDMALEVPSRADFGCNRHCKTKPVDLEGSRGQVLVVLGGALKEVNFPLWPKAGYGCVPAAAPCGHGTAALPANSAMRWYNVKFFAAAPRTGPCTTLASRLSST